MPALRSSPSCLCYDVHSDPGKHGRQHSGRRAAPTLKFSAVATCSNTARHLASRASSLGINIMPTLQVERRNTAEIDGATHGEHLTGVGSHRQRRHMHERAVLPAAAAAASPTPCPAAAAAASPGGLLVQLRHLSLEERPGPLHHNARAVTRHVVGGAGAAVLHAAQCSERLQ